MNRRKIIRILTEAAEKQPELKASCDIQVDRIIALLHVKALEKVPKDVTIENTAVEGEDENSAKFHGAGEHMISARSAKEGESIDRKKAFEAIVAYVSAFLGPDVGKKIKEDSLIPDVNGASGGGEGGDEGGSEGGSEGGDEDEEDEDLDESEREFSLSFSDYLKKRRLYEKAPADKGGDSTPSDGGGDSTPSDGGGSSKDDDEDGDSAPSDGGGDSTSGDGGDEDDDDDDDGDATSGDGDDDGDDEDEGGDDTDGDDDGDDDGDGDKTAKGYYITYILEIEGQKPRKLGDMLKDFGSALMKNFGLRFISGWGDTSGEKHSFKEIADELGNVFGKVDLDSFVDAYSENLKDYYKGATENVVIQLMETIVIKKYCREWIKSSDVKLLDTAKWAVCTRFNKNDKAPELMKPDIIVKAMNESIGSIFKKLKMKLTKTAITEKSVIFIQNYAENVRDKKRTKYNKVDAEDWDKHTPDVKEALDTALAAIGRLKPVFTVGQDDVNRRLMAALFEDMSQKRAGRLLAEADDKEFTITYAVPKKPLDLDGELETKKEIKVKEGGTVTNADEPDPVKEDWIPPDYQLDDENTIWKYVKTSDRSEADPDALKNVTQDITAILVLKKDDRGTNHERFVKFVSDSAGAEKYLKELKNAAEKMKDGDFEGEKYKEDFKIGKFSAKKGEKITVQGVLDLVAELVKNPNKEDAERASKIFSEKAIKALLDATGDSREQAGGYRGDQAYGDKTEWFMYIVPMPGGDRKNDDDNKKEGVTA